MICRNARVSSAGMWEYEPLMQLHGQEYPDLPWAMLVFALCCILMPEMNVCRPEQH